MGGWRGGKICKGWVLLLGFCGTFLRRSLWQYCWMVVSTFSYFEGIWSKVCCFVEEGRLRVLVP